MKTKSISELLNHYIENHDNHEEKMKELIHEIDAFFCELGDDYTEIKHSFHNMIENLTYEIDEERMLGVLEKLNHRDGTNSGMKWTKDDINQIILQYGVYEKIKDLNLKFCLDKFWFAMNYVYAVHFMQSRTINAYIDLAIDELANKNLHFEEIIRNLEEFM